MLLTFAIKNFKSFKHRQVLDLVATPRNEFSESLYEIEDGIKVNTNACVIGPNGCGKTHLLQAIEYFSMAIKNVGGIKEAFQPYKLDRESAKEPTEYEALFYNPKSQEYVNYSFTVLSGNVIAESLYTKHKRKNAKQRKIFERTSDTISFSKDHKALEELLSSTIDSGGLITNYASSIKNDTIKFVHSWACHVLLYDPETGNSDSIEAMQTLFNNFENEKQDFENESQQRTLQRITNIAKQLDLPLKNIESHTSEDGRFYLTFIPTTKNDVDLKLSLAEAEDYFSLGTFNTINMIMILEFLSHYRSTILIDEYDGNLHHKLSLGILDLIRQSNKDSGYSQMIMSTHDIMLLDNNFRRDSIFILNKDEDYSTVITRASEFAVRKDAKLSLKYLNNEFGALPAILDSQQHA
jgi:AAA15 family ATPase/GTPase